jgi:hypothetical protein
MIMGWSLDQMRGKPRPSQLAAQQLFLIVPPTKALQVELHEEQKTWEINRLYKAKSTC